MAFLFNPLHYAVHHAVNWDLADSYSFARNDPWVALARSEIRRLSQVMPILAVERGGRVVPVVPIATSEASLYPLDDDFAWRFGNAPTTLRYHPFQALDTDGGNPVLAVAVDNKTVTPEATNRFFDEKQRPTALVRAILRRLQQLRLEHKQIQDAAGALSEAGLLQPVVELSDRTGRTPFLTIDRQAFHAVAPAELTRLGAVPRHAFLLAAAMLYSARFLPGAKPVDVVAPASQTATTKQAVQPETGYPLADDDAKLFFSFDQN